MSMRTCISSSRAYTGFDWQHYPQQRLRRGQGRSNRSIRLLRRSKFEGPKDQADLDSYTECNTADALLNSTACAVPLWTHRIDRRLLLFGLSISSSLVTSEVSFAQTGGDTSELVEFKSLKNKYRVLRPATWEETSKAGADVLFQDPLQKSTNIGITVSPIRINSLTQFGEVTSVGEKLLATEKSKESTLEVQLLSEGKRVGESGTVIYDFDYYINTTRGAKRVLSTVAIADKKLFIVNGTLKCAVEQCASNGDPAVELISRVTQSFDVLT
eukprot:jgi/Botrbrau1/3563/Bobra.0078s0020.1